jgi:hypothetical protein
MKWLARLALIAALLGLGVWGWRTLFPGPEAVIRSRLTGLARAASFEPDEGTFAKAYNAQKLSAFFTTNAEISVNAPGIPPQSLSGRAEVLQAAMAARSHLKGLKVEFLDANVTLGQDRQTAVVNLTCKATVSGEHDFFVQEFNFMVRKVDGEWLIYRVETVKTLSQHNLPFSPDRTG